MFPMPEQHKTQDHSQTTPNSLAYVSAGKITNQTAMQNHVSKAKKL